MLPGLVLLLVPAGMYLLSLPVTGRLLPGLRLLYRLGGGMIVFAGGSVSVWLAAYSGDQGGVAAFFFQLVVIFSYAILSLLIVTAQFFMRKHHSTELAGPDCGCSSIQRKAAQTLTLRKLYDHPHRSF